MQIEITGVSKAFSDSRTHSQVVALNDIDLQVKDLEFLSILGPTGCGKSTLLYIVSGLEIPTSGTVRFLGEKKSTGPLTAVVWQEYALIPWRTVIHNVAFGLELQGLPKDERLKMAKEFTSLVGVAGFEKHYPHQLSGGMKQRVGLARAFASDPEILLMDEPFASVDVQTRVILQEELLRIWEKGRKTVLFVTHSLEEAILLGDRVAVMTARPGRIKEVIDVKLPRPRDVDVTLSKDFLDIRSYTWNLLKEEMWKLRGE